MATTNDQSTKYRFGIRTPEELRQRSADLRATEYIIDGLVPAQSLGLVVGDSGLGKSPWIYQGAICVAAGIPFLGHNVRRGRVLYLDSENGVAQVDLIVSQISRHLGLQAAPNDLLLWNLNDCDSGCDFGKLVKEAKPNWVIADPLKALFPSIERESKNAIEVYGILRGIMSRHQCAVTGIHHLRKLPDLNFRLWLDKCSVGDWLQQARGARELINGCDVRIGVDRPYGCAADDQLVIRGFRRVDGEIPTERIGRVLDPDGEPLGFRRLSGVALLNNPEQQTVFQHLPPRFSFKEAKAAYGKGDQATRDFLLKCVGANILTNPTRGCYQKTEALDSPEATEPAEAAA